MLKHKQEMRASFGLLWWDRLWAVVRYALQMLSRCPGFAAVAIGSLSLGIGANTAIFTVAQHKLLDRLHGL